jgi:tetratricopeptide (TPR) repeat protein
MELATFIPAFLPVLQPTLTLNFHLNVEKHYQLAVEGYTKAIELNPTNAIYYWNRAFSHIKLEEYGSAVEDATHAIDLDPNYVKGYYRRGDSFLALGKFKLALKDLRTVSVQSSEPAECARGCINLVCSNAAARRSA